MRSVDTLWPQLKPLLLPYQGAASQLYVLDLPLDTLDTALTHFEQSTTRALITSLDGVSYLKESAPQLNAVTRAQILSVFKNKTQNIVSGAFHTNLPVDLWIYENANSYTFDAEFVFWADQFFADANDEHANKKAFEVLLSFAEKLREGHQSCECAFSASEVSDPRNDRDEPWTIFW